jgi:hypothetical protein
MLASGEEKYLCYTVKLDAPADVAVTRFEPFASQVVHHYEVFQALAPEKEGLFDCSQQQIKMSWLPLFGGGAGAAGLQLPQGTGFKLPRSAQLLVQLHLLNAAPAPSESRVVINMDYAQDPAQITPAGIFALGSMDIQLNPGAKDVQLGSKCSLPKPLNVFAVQPHMHKLGTRIELAHGADEAAARPLYKRDPWVFGEQPIDPLTIQLKKGDFVSSTCTFTNTTDRPVSYGENTKDEMCFLVLFYTPFDRLDGCIN